MTQIFSKRFTIKATFGLLAAGLALNGLSGCNGLELPVEVTIPVSTGSTIVAANAADGSATVVLSAFCDLFSEEELDALIRQFGGDVVADIVDITGVELDKVTVTATSGNFDSFSTADLDMIFLGDAPLPLGSAEDSEGLGTVFELTQGVPVDLLNDLEDGECGAPTLELNGEQPEADITFNTTATLQVYTRLSL
jgi:hypothetical protein